MNGSARHTLASPQVLENADCVGIDIDRMVKKVFQRGRSERRGEEVHTKLRLSRSLRSHASGELLGVQVDSSVHQL